MIQGKYKRDDLAVFNIGDWGRFACYVRIHKPNPTKRNNLRARYKLLRVE